MSELRPPDRRPHPGATALQEVVNLLRLSARIRRSVLPGVTGLWQVSGRSEGDMNVQEVMDTYYIRNWSLWMDLYILGKTLAAVVRGRGAY